jgi:hypothetical protein
VYAFLVFSILLFTFIPRCTSRYDCDGVVNGYAFSDDYLLLIKERCGVSCCTDILMLQTISIVISCI